MGGHSSRRRIAPPLKQPTRATSRNRPICRPYSVLLPVGFAMPFPLPATRWALTPPFRPYRTEARRIAFCGTFPGVAPAGHYPAPSFRGARTFLAPACAGPRPPGPLAGGDIARQGAGCKSGRAMSAIEEGRRSNGRTAFDCGRSAGKSFGHPRGPGTCDGSVPANVRNGRKVDAQAAALRSQPVIASRRVAAAGVTIDTL